MKLAWLDSCFELYAHDLPSAGTLDNSVLDLRFASFVHALRRIGCRG